MSLIGLLVIALIIAFAVGLASRNRWFAIVSGAVSLSLVAYVALGMIIPRITGVGRFYSLPFGGMSVSDWNVTASLAFWLAAFGTALYALIPKREKGAGGGIAWGRLARRAGIGIAPLCLTPLWGWLIADGYLNFGGGEKDLFLLIPWMVWSFAFFIAFLVMSVKKAALGRSLGWAAGIAAGTIAVLFTALYFTSISGIGGH